MIIIFTYKGHVSNNLCFLLENSSNIDKNEFIILSKYKKKYFEKADAIIPFGIKSQKILNQYDEFKDKYLINSKYVYNSLNNKISFYKIIQDYDFLKNSPIKLIKTYDETYNGSNINGKFIIKHEDGSGSLNNEIVTGNIYNLIKKYSIDHQIQDILKINKIHAINCVCKNGIIISGLNFISGAVNPTTIHSNLKQNVIEIDSIFMNIITKIIKHYNYNGLIEFEFLEDTNKDIYLMECNPRISGNIKCLDLNGKAPYIDRIISPYCDIIKHNIDANTNKINNKYDTLTDIIYYGEFKESKYIEHKDGLIQLI